MRFWLGTLEVQILKKAHFTSRGLSLMSATEVIHPRDVPVLLTVFME